MRFPRPLTAVALAAGLALSPVAVLPAFSQAAEAQSFSDADLTAFAEVAIEVAQIRDAYAARLAEAASDAEQQEIVAEGNAAMLTAVEESPQISLDLYLEIGEAAASDPELNDRLVMLINEMTGMQ